MENTGAKLPNSEITTGSGTETNTYTTGSGNLPSGPNQCECNVPGIISSMSVSSIHGYDTNVVLPTTLEDMIRVEPLSPNGVIDGVAVKGWLGGVRVVKLCDSSEQIGERFEFCEVSFEPNLKEDENQPMERQLEEISVNGMEGSPVVLGDI